MELVERERFASHSVDQDHRDHRTDDVDDRCGERPEERGGRVDTDRLPQRRRVVERHVDADELLEHREADTDPDDRQEAEAAAEQVLEGGLVLAVHGCLDLGHAGVEVDFLALDLGEDLLGPLVLADGDQVARRLGDRERQQAVEERRDDHDAEHPLPGLEAADRSALLAVGELEDAEVHQLRDGDADDDRGLLEGAELGRGRRRARPRRYRPGR